MRTDLHAMALPLLRYLFYARRITGVSGENQRGITRPFCETGNAGIFQSGCRCLLSAFSSFITKVVYQVSDMTVNLLFHFTVGAEIILPIS